MASRAVLITGGAGYIGAHAAKALYDRGWKPIAYDNLSAGFREAVRWGELICADVGDGRALREALQQHKVEAIIHFAGLADVGLSTRAPDLFWRENVAKLQPLLDAAKQTGVRRLIFSSSAAVYGTESGEVQRRPLRENDAKVPSNPYGDTKLAGERLIAAHCAAFGLSAFALRYFNAAGADPSGLIGEAHDPETHLIPLALMAAMGQRKPLTVFGSDYPTPDGTAVRDYVHVSDLAEAHVAALEAPAETGSFEALNLGAGRGTSVQEVLDAVDRLTDRTAVRRIGPRRPGDPAMLVADVSRARRRLGWSAQRSDIGQIVSDALAWHQRPAYGISHRAIA